MLRRRRATTLTTAGASGVDFAPEELTHGMIFAVADAVRSEAGNTDLLNAWKRCLLSTPFAFMALATAGQRTWYALQLREILSTEYFACLLYTSPSPRDS